MAELTNNEVECSVILVSRAENGTQIKCEEEEISDATPVIIPPLPPGSPPSNGQFQQSAWTQPLQLQSKQTHEIVICKDFNKSNCHREDCKYSHIIFCHNYVNRGSCNLLKCRFIHSSKEEESHYKLTGVPPVCTNSACNNTGCQLRHIKTDLSDKQCIAAPLSDIPSAMDPNFLEKIQMRPPPPPPGSSSTTNVNYNQQSQRRGKGGLSNDSNDAVYCTAENSNGSHEEPPAKRGKYVTDNVHLSEARSCSQCTTNNQLYTSSLKRLNYAMEKKSELKIKESELEVRVDTLITKIITIMRENSHLNSFSTHMISNSNRMNLNSEMAIDNRQLELNIQKMRCPSIQSYISTAVPLNSNSNLLNVVNNGQTILHNPAVRFNSVNVPISQQNFETNQQNMQQSMTALGNQQNSKTHMGQQMPTYHTQICG